MLRHDLGLTQEAIAELCGLDDGSWSNWERGTKPQDMLAKIDKIAEATGYDPVWLAFGESATRQKHDRTLVAVPGGRKGLTTSHQPSLMNSLAVADALP